MFYRFIFLVQIILLKIPSHIAFWLITLLTMQFVISHIIHDFD